METFATIVNSEYIWEIPGHCLRVTSLVSQRREDDITVLVEGNNGFDHDGPIVLAFLDKAKPDQQVDFVFTERVVFRTERTPFAVFGTIEPICENDMESYDDSESEDDSEEGSNQWIDSKVNGVIIEEVTDATANRKRLRDTEAPELVPDEVEISKPKVDLKPSLKPMSPIETSKSPPKTVVFKDLIEESQDAVKNTKSGGTKLKTKAADSVKHAGKADLPAEANKTKATPTKPEVSLKVSKPNGLKYEILRSAKDGNSGAARRGSKITVTYTGLLSKTGKKFDSGNLNFTVGGGEVVPGFDQGVEGMLVGEKRRVFIPSKLGYGVRGAGPIPPNADLIFEIGLTNVRR